MDALKVRGILSDGIGRMLDWPVSRFLDADQKAVLTACRREVLSDDELCGRIAQRVLTYMRGEEMALNLFPLPTTLGDAPTVFINAINGTVVDKGEIAHAGLHVVSFILGQFHVHEDIKAAVTLAYKGASELTDDEVVAQLEFLKTFEANPNGLKAAIDWKSLAVAVIQIVLRLLLEQPPAALKGCDICAGCTVKIGKSDQYPKKVVSVDCRGDALLLWQDVAGDLKTGTVPVDLLEKCDECELN